MPIPVSSSTDSVFARRWNLRGLRGVCVLLRDFLFCVLASTVCYFIPVPRSTPTGVNGYKLITGYGPSSSSIAFHKMGLNLCIYCYETGLGVPTYWCSSDFPLRWPYPLCFQFIEMSSVSDICSQCSRSMPSNTLLLSNTCISIVTQR